MFSIGIPAYKSKFLNECIESILLQSYINFEVIIINDCSPDNITDIVLAFNDDRIKYYVNDKNTGAENVIVNWNKCLEKASGEYFVLMGDDDKMDPNYLEEFTKLIHRYPDLDIYHCRSKIIDEKSIVFGLTSINPEFENIYDYVLSCLENKRHQFISDFVYQTESLKSRGGFYNLPLAWYSDYVSSYIACGMKGIAHTNNPVFNYRVNQKNITSVSKVEVKHVASLRMFRWVQNFLSSVPVDELDLLNYISIKKSLNKAITIARFSFIRQYLGEGNFFLKLFKCWIKRKKFHVSAVDFIRAFLSAISDKIIN